MEKAKILYVSQEIFPYLPDSEMSRIGRALPEGVMQYGKEFRTFMPRFGKINERRNQLHEVIRLSGMNIVIDDTDHPLIIKVASIQAIRMQIYFIDNDDYFTEKTTVRRENGEEYPENDERSIFFARGVLETSRKLGWAPEIIHLNGWFTMFVAVFVRYYMNKDPHFSKSRIVITIYDDEFVSKWDGEIQKKLYVEGMDEKGLSTIKVDDYVSLMKMAIDLCDGVVQGSAKVNEELVAYAKASGKPFLEYHDEASLAKACSDFYDLVLATPSEYIK